MPSIATTKQLEARGFYDGSLGGGAQWAFFAIAFVAFAIAVFGTIRINKRRNQAGVKPIYGTRWMTPPTYVQAQGQGASPNGMNPHSSTPYVPTYTTQANADDMGYFAPDGTFHANPNAKKPQYPENAYPRAFSNADGRPIQNWGPQEPRVVADEDAEFYRPSGPPPASSSVQRSGTVEFERPNHPPPAR